MCTNSVRAENKKPCKVLIYKALVFFLVAGAGMHQHDPENVFNPEGEGIG